MCIIIKYLTLLRNHRQQTETELRDPSRNAYFRFQLETQMSLGVNRICTDIQRKQ